VGVHGELLPALPRQDAVLGGDADLRDDRVGVPAVGHAGGDPPADDPVLVAAGVHLPAAAVRDRADGLLQKQRGVGGGGQEPPAAGLLHQRLVVEFRLEAQQRQAEAVLPAGLAVAAAGVAPELGEHRHDLVREVDRQVLADVLGGDRDAGGLAAERGHEFGGAVGPRGDPAGRGDGGDLAVGDGVRGVVGEVAEPAVGEGGGDDELGGVVAAGERDLRRVDRQPRHVGRLRRLGGRGRREGEQRD
jgi:hypothetical protein